MPNPSRLLASAAVFIVVSAAAQQVVIDATSPVPVPQPVAATLGTSVSPSGQTIGVNSQYLTLNGQPWLPVMGEFHYSRYPEKLWEQEILKMQAAGVQIISTYVIWIHHEQQQGVFDWTGQRDLRHFTELCAKHGMYVYPRIGPWAHAEVRHGGLPDWVLKVGPTRENDPTYLAEVQTFYQQIALQLQGLLWKDGGPVIGLQVENEYRSRGPGKGDEHIRTLKKMAVADGLDVPLYTVTGWDGAAVPLNAALPVYGGYPDAPWDGSPKKLPPNEVYAFRFANRSAGSMGAIGGGDQSSADTYRGTPFLTAEVGDGIEDTYFRRPVVTADDVAALPTIMLGSGANLLGYYMFHGGRNPQPEPGTDITLQESQLTGYPTDLPLRSYDFQAPLGEFGQERESLRKLKLVHYFLNDFGASLAPMAVRPPATLPANPSDLSVPRVSARTAGERGYIFFNNHVRGVDDPPRTGFQVLVHLPGGSVRIPDQPLTLPPDAYGIWPINLQCGSTTLRYATAQLFKRVQVGSQTWFFFFAIPGVAPEFAFSGSPSITTTGAPVQVLGSGGLLRLRPSGAAELQLPGKIHLVLLPQQLAESIWRVSNPSVLLRSDAAVYSDGNHWTLDAEGRNVFDFATFGIPQKISANAKVESLPPDFLFTRYRAAVPAVTLAPQVLEVHDAGPRLPSTLGPAFAWRKDRVPVAPEEEEFAKAAAWSITVPTPPSTLADALLTVHYTGDVARLYRGSTLVDDNFWNGIPFQVGLDEIGQAAPTTFTLRILPLRADYSLYLQDPGMLNFAGKSQVATLNSVKVIPVYRLTVETAPARGAMEQSVPAPSPPVPGQRDKP
jgi:beta-galactosidase